MIEPYIAFLLKHWVLTSAFFIVVIAFLLNEWRNRAFGVAGLSNQKLVEMLNHSHATVIDIRSAELFQKGHIIGAVNCPQTEINQRLQSLNKYKSKAMIIVCANGTQAPEASRLLTKAGFTQLHYLAAGMMGWIQEGMPVVKN